MITALRMLTVVPPLEPLADKICTAIHPPKGTVSRVDSLTRWRVLAVGLEDSRCQMGRSGRAITSAGEKARVLTGWGFAFGPERSIATPGIGSLCACQLSSVASSPKTTRASDDVVRASEAG